ncbi:MAG: hypothetical protein P4L56_11630 [Candidatus Sulfopaludibacter sp.]|nr:hypothetical protein [Candidatus Sulfopaludibacter sp.]
MIEENRLRERVREIAGLVRRLDAVADPAVKVQVQKLLQSVMDLHGEAFERMLERLRSTGTAGEALLDSMVADPVVASLLVLHGLHPVEFETRVRRAIEGAQSALRSYGAIAELGGARAGDVKIRIRGVNDAVTARAVKSLVEEELYAAAPDAVSLDFLGLEKFSAPDFVPLEQVGMLAAGKAGG